VADKWNPVEAGCQPAKPTSLPLRCHAGKEVKHLRKAATNFREAMRRTTAHAQEHPSPKEGQQAPEGDKRGVGEPLSAHLPLEDPDHTQRPSLDPRVVIPFLFFLLLLVSLSLTS